MISIVWSAEARRDLHRIRDFLEPKDADAARAAVLAVFDAVERLTDFPSMGTLVDTSAYRKLTIGRSGYLVIYRATQSSVVIVRIYHAREDWRPR